MGIDLGQMFEDAKKAASQGMQDALNTGGNAALGFLEGQAVSVIQADQSKHEQAAQNATTDIMNRPSSPFGKYLGNMMQQPIIKQYGVYILGGIVVVAGLVIYLKK